MEESAEATESRLRADRWEEYEVDRSLSMMMGAGADLRDIVSGVRVLDWWVVMVGGRTWVALLENLEEA